MSIELTAEMVAAVRRQLDLDRAQSSYWRGKWADGHGDEHIEAWLDSLADWLPEPKESRRNGICGARLPVLVAGAAMSVCVLEAGHDGWHETGSVWSDQLGFLEPTRWSPAVTA